MVVSEDSEGSVHPLMRGKREEAVVEAVKPRNSGPENILKAKLIALRQSEELSDSCRAVHTAIWALLKRKEPGSSYYSG